ncbi:phage portal protein [Lactiplantibacillus plantarum]|uniref:phage portal protein n=1 Tax=Lactiplantibacillus plantarum TaxID=1590 RepID=UPI00295AD122|nr:phage portal protein [Lactiplantibacillus plantarum]MDV9115406.1 phage portal protein [Lactiplantibacillus plantarum]
MGLFSKVANFLIKAGDKMIGAKSMTHIWDDDRIAITAEEYRRLLHAINIYTGDHLVTNYLTSKGEPKTRDKYTLNLSKVASRRIASLCVNEKFTVEIGSLANQGDDEDVGKSNDAEVVNDYIKGVLTNSDFQNQLESNIEHGTALGYMVARPYVDTNDNYNIKVAWSRADQAYPLRSSSNGMKEICLATRTQVTEQHTPIWYTLLEFHQWDGSGQYVISNELYRSGSVDVIGDQVPLAMQYPNLEPQTVVADRIYPEFAVFKTPGFNNRNLDSSTGLGVIDNSLRTLEAINDTYDALHWEIITGKRQVIVPPEMVKTAHRRNRNGDVEDQSMVDDDTDVFVSANSQADDFKPVDITRDLRVDQLNSAITEFIHRFEMESGLSSGTFSYDTAGKGSSVTATQVVSENSLTYQTRSSYLTMIDQFINQLIHAIIEIATTPQYFPNGVTPLDNSVVDYDDLDIETNYDDGVFTDKASQATYIEGLTNAGLMSKVKAIAKLQDIPLDKAEKEYQQILKESVGAMASKTPDITDLFGNNSSSE